MTETQQWPTTTSSPQSQPSPSPPTKDPQLITVSSNKPATRPRKIRKLSSSPIPTQQQQQSPAPVPLRVVPRPLTAPGEISAALAHLRRSDPSLAAVIDLHGPPTFHPFLPPFQTLTRSIINQQLAFKAAATTYSRFVSLCGVDERSISPASVLSLSLSDLRHIGISSRKASYLRDLARKFHTGVLSDDLILSMDDKSVISMLTMVEGIGAWSVHMFLIFSLHRPDVLPVGDAGVRKGVQLLYGLEETPRPSQMEKICERWRPYRSVGSWYMWRLSEGKPNGSGNGLVAAGGEAGHHHQQQQALLLDNIQVFSPSSTSTALLLDLFGVKD